MVKVPRKEELLTLLKKYQSGKANDKERAFIEKYYQFFDQKDDPSNKFSKAERQDTENRMLENIHFQIRHQAKGSIIPLYKRTITWVAASALLIIGIGTFYVFNRNTPARSAPIALEKGITPGTNGAILKLANGKMIVLDTAQNGSLWQNNHSKVLKTDSSVAFSTGPNIDEAGYNMLITPNARQEQLILSDGTKIWLNAASSIKFPTAFTAKERVVEITGEAYFEVSKNAAHPFVVKVNDVDIKVLGTHFNVMAYNNEQSLQTTLLEGSVVITEHASNHSQILKPGEQVLINNKSGNFEVNTHADVKLVTAWKDGLLAFNNADIATIMREVERWYNVKAIYPGAVPERIFSGEIPRSSSLTELLKLFEVNKIHFVIDASKREITVLP